jgi:hypothetical protein
MLVGDINDLNEVQVLQTLQHIDRNQLLTGIMPYILRSA